MRTKYLVAVVVAAASLAALAWLLLARTSPLTGAGSAPPTAKPAQVIASIEVEGRGTVLANGTSTLFWNSTKPLKLVLEAKPEKCWAFKGWLVNGTPYSAEPNATLTVRGNTTVKAVFERPVYAVSIVPVFHPVSLGANASARVNGTLRPLPANASAPACSLLEVEPVAPKSWEALNGTLRFTVNGSLSVKLFYRRSRVTATFRNIVVPVLVSWPGGNTTLRSDAALELPFNTTVALSPWGTDRRGCAPYNETHFACLAAWSNGTGVIPFRNPTLRLEDDVVLEEVVEYMARQYPTVFIDVATPTGTVKAAVFPPIEDLITAFRGTYRYAGDGWLEASGEMWVLRVALPPWRKLRIHVVSGGNIDVEVIIRNEPTFFAAGRGTEPGYCIFEVDWEFVEKLRYVESPADIPEDWWRSHFKCTLAKDSVRVECKVLIATGPGRPRVAPAQTGWLLLVGHTSARIKIEVVEAP